jgi:hypothetical protein
MEIGVDSFVAATVDLAADRAVDPAKDLSELLEAIMPADQVGLDDSPNGITNAIRKQKKIRWIQDDLTRGARHAISELLSC